jgi:hypothetical protein
MTKLQDAGDRPPVASARPAPGWREVLSRCAAAVLGGYAATYCLTAFLSVYLPMSPANNVFIAGMLAFAAYAGAILYAFSARHHAWAWGNLMVASVLFAAAAFIPGAVK